MKTLIIGGGAIGSYLAARFTTGGLDVTLHGLGVSFERISADGIRLVEHGSDCAKRVALHCSITAPPADGWDMVVFAVKAQDLPNAARQFADHARNAVSLLPQNGLPYWQFLGTSKQSMRLRSVDPQGIAESALALERVAGCVVTKGLSFRPDGTLVEAVSPSDKFTVGDVIPGSEASRLPVSLFGAAGLPVAHTTDIRLEKWKKLLINVVFNPLGAISHLGFGEVLVCQEGECLARALMDEAYNVALAAGLSEKIDASNAFDRARSSLYHKTSMLQDVEAGRQLEIGPIVGAMLELADAYKVPIPSIRAIYSCLSLISHALLTGPIKQEVGASKA